MHFFCLCRTFMIFEGFELKVQAGTLPTLATHSMKLKLLNSDILIRFKKCILYFTSRMTTKYFHIF
jgi:hypothetical protein